MRILLFVFLLTGFITFAQNREEQTKKTLEEAKNRSEKYTQKGNKAFNSDKPIQAEVEYRNAIAENKENGIAQYNLGTMYYKQKSYDEAFYRLKNASTSAEVSHAEKHQIFHNLGNTFMKEKAYEKAVQAYQEALRNNPNDEETRYNLAVAKEMLKKNPPQNQDNKDNKQDNNENKNDENKDSQNKEENKDQNKDNKQDNKENEKEENKDNQDNKNNKDKEKDDNKEDKNQDKGNNQDRPNNPEEGKNDKDKGEGKNTPASLSPQQMERILEAMNNEDRKVQEKINAKKVKGERIKSEKDW